MFLAHWKLTDVPETERAERFAPLAKAWDVPNPFSPVA